MKQIVLSILTILIISCNNKKDDPQPNQTTNNPPVIVTNNPPILQANLSYATTSATPLPIDLSSKITDPENDIWSITTATANHGSVSISGTTINYTSNASYSGNDTITVSIKDSKGAVSTGKIAIVVSSTNPTNHTPVINASLNMTLYNVQFLGNTYGYDISIKSRPNTNTFNVTDADNDNVAITSITGYSSNIQSINGIATNITADDIANGNFSGDIQIIPFNKVYAGIETFNITFSDGKKTVTKTFTIQFGSSSQIETYNILKGYFGTQIPSFIGNVTFNAGTITTTQNNPDFFGTVTSPSTYQYSITSNGMIVFIVGSIQSTYSIQSTSTYFSLTNESTGDNYVFGI